MNEYSGNFDGKGLKIGIVISRFNNFITERILEGAMDVLIRHGVLEKDIDVYRVPGAFEIPQSLKIVTAKGTHDGVICLGAVIRGDTPHFNYISAEVTKGIAAIAMNSEIPISYGILTTDTIEQAIERAGTKSGNKGSEASFALLEMINLFKNI